MKKIHYFIVFLLFIFIFCFGFYFGKGNLKKMAQEYDRGYQAGWNALRARINDSQKFEDIPIVNSFLGEVFKKEFNKVYIKLSYADPMLDPDLDDRIVVIGSETEIFRMVKRDDNQYQKEMSDYLKNNQKRGPDGGVSVPDLFVKENKDLEDIIVGKRITVKTKENIKFKKEFTADQIIILND